MIKTYRLVVFDVEITEEFENESSATDYVKKDAKERGVPLESERFILIERINHVDFRAKASHPGMDKGLDKPNIWYRILYAEDDPSGVPIYVLDDDNCG